MREVMREVMEEVINRGGMLWAVLALITFLTAYYVQIINRLLDIKPNDERDKRRKAKYYLIRTLLSWMVALLFVAIFTIALIIPPLYRGFVKVLFLLSQIIHVIVFLESYGRDLIGEAKIREGYWKDGGWVKGGREAIDMQRMEERERVMGRLGLYKWTCRICWILGVVFAVLGVIAGATNIALGLKAMFWLLLAIVAFLASLPNCIAWAAGLRLCAIEAERKKEE